MKKETKEILKVLSPLIYFTLCLILAMIIYFVLGFQKEFLKWIQPLPNNSSFLIAFFVLLEPAVFMSIVALFSLGLWSLYKKFTTP